MKSKSIPYDEFALLQLSQFLPVWQRFSIRKLHNWEFLGKIWIGEAIGFTEFLRLEIMPQQLGAISIDLKALSAKSVHAILRTIHFPVTPYASREEVERHLGQPKNILTFRPDRETLEFSIGKTWPYYVTCTIHHEEGLVYVVAAREDMLQERSAKK